MVQFETESTSEESPILMTSFSEEIQLNQTRLSSPPCGFKHRTEAAYVSYFGLGLSCIIIFQSAVTVVAVRRNPVLHTNQYIFLVSLALVDMFLSVTFGGNICFHLSQVTPRQININLADTILFGVTFSAVTLGAIHMGVIACERYLRIAYPFYYIRYMTKQRILKILLCAWMPTVINSITPVIFYMHDKYHIRCINMHPPLAYFSANAVIIFINTVIVVICYSKIVNLAIKHNKSANVRRLQRGTDSGDNVSRQFWTTLLKSIKFCIIMCGIYFVCCVPPFFTITVGFSHDISELIPSIMLYAYPLHSVLNFFVSCKMNNDFFTALKKMFSHVKLTYCFQKK